MSDYLADIEALTFNLKGDLELENFIEESQKAIQIINSKIFEAQEEINQKVEYFIDSFGDENCTMRQLKSEEGKL
jgi:hypothetical protein